MTDNGYITLAGAVVKSAYHALVREMIHDNNPAEIHKLIEFFTDSPFMAVFDIDPEYIIRKAREEADSIRRKRA